MSYYRGLSEILLFVCGALLLIILYFAESISKQRHERNLISRAFRHRKRGYFLSGNYISLYSYDNIAKCDKRKFSDRTIFYDALSEALFEIFYYSKNFPSAIWVSKSVDAKEKYPCFNLEPFSKFPVSVIHAEAVHVPEFHIHLESNPHVSEIYLPSVKMISFDVLSCPNLKKIVFTGNEPPSLVYKESEINPVSASFSFFVPADAMDAYASSDLTGVTIKDSAHNLIPAQFQPYQRTS